MHDGELTLVHSPERRWGFIAVCVLPLTGICKYLSYIQGVSTAKSYKKILKEKWRKGFPSVCLIFSGIHTFWLEPISVELKWNFAGVCEKEGPGNTALWRWDLLFGSISSHSLLAWPSTSCSIILPQVTSLIFLWSLAGDTKDHQCLNLKLTLAYYWLSWRLNYPVAEQSNHQNVAKCYKQGVC